MSDSPRANRCRDGGVGSNDHLRGDLLPNNGDRAQATTRHVQLLECVEFYLLIDCSRMRVCRNYPIQKDDVPYVL